MNRFMPSTFSMAGFRVQRGRSVRRMFPRSTLAEDGHNRAFGVQPSNSAVPLVDQPFGGPCERMPRVTVDLLTSHEMHLRESIHNSRIRASRERKSARLWPWMKISNRNHIIYISIGNDLRSSRTANGPLDRSRECKGRTFQES
jgi:hypothetical protein